jgi:hypothetical protein
MPFTLDKVVPWGRSFQEYIAMFDLSGSDLGRNILGCGDGPSSFNCAMSRRGRRVISADPIYRFSAGEIRARIDETYEAVLEQTRRNAHEFVWTEILSVEELCERRLADMKDFLADYETGRKEGRYIEAELPGLPFASGAFELALCSHFLFLYSEQLSSDFHVGSIRELCRVASEVRIFPVLEMGARRSRHLDAVIDELRRENYRVELRRVPYEFQRGGNEMMVVTSLESPGDNSV